MKAQFGSPAGALKLKEPVASRVYQRDINGKAEIPVILDDSMRHGELFEAHVHAGNMATQAIKLVDGKLVENLHVANSRRLVALADRIAELESAT